ncbi:AP-like endonuclease reverse transcriptase, partial [Brachionus plicatilis]
MTTNSLKILHINIYSSNSDTKILQLTRLIQIFKIDIISINETFLKPNDPFSLPGFTIVRDDRLQRRGGGTALCIKDSIEFHEIPRLCSATHENIVGVNITIGKNEKLAIFTIYNSPSTVLNDETLHFINSHFPKFIIVGDLNSKSKTWHCIKENTNGEILENFINAPNCHVLNCEKPTFPRGNSIIDLTICSQNMYDFFHSHKVLADKISDHQPTITSFKNLIPRKKLFTINKIDWAKFDQILKFKKGDHALDTPLNIDTEADKIIADILDAFNKAAKLCNFTTTATHPIPIPENLVKKIKFKRKLCRLNKKCKTELTTKLLNLISRQISNEIKALKGSFLSEKFSALNQFNQSESKCWNLLNNFIDPNKASLNKQIIKLRKNETISEDPEEVANLFGEHLEKIFTADHCSTNLP